MVFMPEIREIQAQMLALAFSAVKNRSHFKALETVLGSDPVVFAATRQLYVSLNKIQYNLMLRHAFLEKVIKPLCTDSARKISENDGLPPMLKTPYDPNFYRLKLRKYVQDLLNGFQFITDFKASNPHTRQLIENLIRNSREAQLGERLPVSLEEFFLRHTLSLDDIKVYRAYHLREWVGYLEELLVKCINKPDQFDTGLDKILKSYKVQFEQDIQSDRVGITTLKRDIRLAKSRAEQEFITDITYWWDSTTHQQHIDAGFPNNVTRNVFLSYIDKTENGGYAVPVLAEDGGNTLSVIAASHGNERGLDYLLAGGASVSEVNLNNVSIASFAVGLGQAKVIQVVAKHKVNEMDQPLDPVVFWFRIWCENGLQKKRQYQVDVKLALEKYRKNNYMIDRPKEPTVFDLLYRLFFSSKAILKSRADSAHQVEGKYSEAVLNQNDDSMYQEIETCIRASQRIGNIGRSRLFGPLIMANDTYKTDAEYGFHRIPLTDLVHARAVAPVPVAVDRVELVPPPIVVDFAPPAGLFAARPPDHTLTPT